MPPDIRLATLDDVAALVDLRTKFLAEVTGSCAGPELIEALTQYFLRTLATGEFVAYVAESEGRIIATSGLVYYRHPPSAANLHSCEAYVMNMYTLPVWRGQGIATTLLDRLIELAQHK